MKFFLNCIKRHCQESEAELNSFPSRLSSFDEMPLVFFGGFRFNYDNCNRYSQLQKLFGAVYAHLRILRIRPGSHNLCWHFALVPLSPARLAHYQYAHPLAKSRHGNGKPCHATPTSPHPGPPNSFNQVGNALARALLSNEDNVASNATSGVACLVGFDFLLLPIMSCLIPCCLLLLLRLRLHLSRLGGSCSC